MTKTRTKGEWMGRDQGMKQIWELVNPGGVVKVEHLRLSQRPSTLTGKTVVLRWNGKPNGDLFLDKVAQMLAHEVKRVRVIKAWEVAPETIEPISGSQELSLALMQKIAALKPDLVIGAQGD
jgi:hypothetical protein